MKEASPTGCRPIRRRRKDARPAELCAAALAVFAEKGFAATRLEDVAVRAGVGKGTIYLYFESKEALFRATVEGAMMPALEAAEVVAADGSLSASELLRKVILAWWRMIGSGAAAHIPKLLLAESHALPDTALRFKDCIIQRANRAVTQIIESGVASGEFRRIEPHVAAQLVFAPILSILLWRQAAGPLDPDLPEPEAFLNFAADTLVTGLAVRRAAFPSTPPSVFSLPESSL